MIPYSREMRKNKGYHPDEIHREKVHWPNFGWLLPCTEYRLMAGSTPYSPLSWLASMGGWNACSNTCSKAFLIRRLVRSRLLLVVVRSTSKFTTRLVLIFLLEIPVDSKYACTWYSAVVRSTWSSAVCEKAKEKEKERGGTVEWECGYCGVPSHPSSTWRFSLPFLPARYLTCLPDLPTLILHCSLVW